MKASLRTPKSFGPAAVQRVASTGLKTLIDNRPTAVAQRKLQQLVREKGVGQLKAFQGASVVQRVVEQIPGSGATPRWRSTLIPNRVFDSQAAAQEADTYSRLAAMTPLPLAFGSGASYGFHGFPELGTIPRADVSQVQERVYTLGPMMHTLSPQNHQFNTSEPPRAPTMYFQELGQGLNVGQVISSGRVRQQHPDGPAVYIDEHPRQHFFSADERLLDIDHEYHLRRSNIVAVNRENAVEGMHHIEVHHNDPNHRSWEVAHASGGGLSNTSMTPHEIDLALLRAATNPNSRVEDRRR